MRWSVFFFWRILGGGGGRLLDGCVGFHVVSLSPYLVYLRLKLVDKSPGLALLCLARGNLAYSRYEGFIFWEETTFLKKKKKDVFSVIKGEYSAGCVLYFGLLLYSLHNRILLDKKYYSFTF